MRKAGSKATPWSVKGIDDATRAAAREAAREAGLTLGAWIDRAILRHAGIAPVPANDVSDTDINPGAGAEPLETRIAAAEGRIEGQLRPVGLAVARVAQRMVQLERGLKSLPPDWPSTVTVAGPAPSSGEDPVTAKDPMAGGAAGGAPDDENVFPSATTAEKPPTGEEDWEARWDRFKAELAGESRDEAELSGPPESAAVPASAAPEPAGIRESQLPPAAPDRRPVRRHFPGKLIVGGLVLIIGVGSGIALMSQRERLGMAPALQRAADGVLGLGEDAKAALRSGTRWIEDLAWQLRSGRDSAGDDVSAERMAADSAPPDSPATPSGGNSPPLASISLSESALSKPPPSLPAPVAELPAPPASSLRTPLPAAPPTVPVPAASADERGDARAAARPEIAALPDVEDSGVKPGVPSPGFAGLVEQRARQGDPEAQHDLAVLYATGNGRPQDMREAAYWFREAAIQGVPGAQYNLGVLYEKGTGVQQDDVRALLWYHSAAERNHPRAQYNLGRFYAHGRGIPVNYAEARKWLRRAGDQNMTAALFELGQMEERGLGDAPDLGKARALYAQAAALGDQAAAKRLVAMPPGSGAAPSEAAGSAAKTGAGATPVPAPATPLSPEAERETLRAIQQILIRLGYEVGVADGLLGERTRDGIREYQRRHDLPVNGTPSALLLQHMVQTMGESPAAGQAANRTISR